MANEHALSNSYFRSIPSDRIKFEERSRVVIRLERAGKIGNWALVLGTLRSGRRNVWLRASRGEDCYLPICTIKTLEELETLYVEFANDFWRNVGQAKS